MSESYPTVCLAHSRRGQPWTRQDLIYTSRQKAHCIMGFIQFWINNGGQTNQGTSVSNPNDISHESNGEQRQACLAWSVCKSRAKTLEMHGISYMYMGLISWWSGMATLAFILYGLFALAKKKFVTGHAHFHVKRWYYILQSVFSFN